jgi:drug/metabolite transporter (DMT)-like permease
MAAASGSILIIKHLSEQFGPWTITAVQTLAGAIFFLPGIGPLLHVPAADLASVLPVAAYLGSCVTLGAFGLYNIGVARIPASRASVFINLVPVVAVFFAWLFLGETLNPMQLLAAGCIFLGVWVTQKSA